MSIVLTDMQSQAIESIVRWYKDKNAVVNFILAGMAGSGKTTLIPFIIEALNLPIYRIKFAAFTGKAAMVMRKKGLPASTIHSLIYKPKEFTDKDGKRSVMFELVKHIDGEPQLIVIDEASMVSKKLKEDLESFDIPILYVGDHGQLPPVSSDQINMMEYPDFVLTEIHRQALENPIIWIAHEVRQGKRIQCGKYGNSVIKIPESKVSDTMMLNSSQIICGMNKTRKDINHHVRMLKGFDGVFPEESDKLICLKNNHDLGLFNGMIGTCYSIDHKKELLTFENDDEELYYDLIYDTDIFRGEKAKYNKKIEQFDFGYCITAHKCLTGDTLVYTNVGIQQLINLKDNIKNIKVYNGEELEYPSMFIDNGISKINKLTTQRGYSISATDEHGLDVLQDNTIIRKNVNEIAINDVLVLRVGQNIFGELNELPKEWAIRNLNVRATLFNRPNYMTPEFAMFLGFMVADGTVDKKRIKFSKRHKDVSEKFLEIFKSLFGKDNNIKLRPSGDYMVEISSSDIAQFCSYIGGLLPNNKFVPEIILQSNKECQQNFLRALFEDGSVQLKKKTNYNFGHVEFSAKEETLIDQVNAMLLNFGIVCSKRKVFKTDKKYNKERHIFKLYIYGEDAALFKEEIGFVSKFKQERLKLCKSKTNKKKYVYDHIVKKETAFEHTYCLEMPKSHKFVQNGFCGWNSQGSQFQNVLIYEEMQFLGGEFFSKWLYTGITRAEEKIIIVE